MKFSQLAVGQSFSYQGACYRKISPLMAQAEGASQARLIARSADVQPTGETATPKLLPAQIPRQRVDRAMQQLAGQITDAVAACGLTAEEVNALLSQLQQAFDDCRRALELD